MRNIISLSLKILLFTRVLLTDAQLALTETDHGFYIELNGEHYNSSTSISPQIPIKVVFRIKESSATQVRMQHPENPSLFRNFELGKTYRLTNHEHHMQQGHQSSSDFIAMNSSGVEIARIKLTFNPK